MKLTGAQANGYFSKPDPSKAGLLIYGTDAMRVALKRQDVIAALVGPQGEEEMRLTRIPASELRKDKALLLDAVKAIGFFPGPRVAFVEDANSFVDDTIIDALNQWQEGDTQIIVTAGNLKKTSKTLKAFEGHKNAFAAAIFDNPPTRQEIETALREAGLPPPTGTVMDVLNDLAQSLSPGDFRQTVDKITLYKLSDSAPLSEEDIAACAPSSTEADIDDILMIVADARADQIGPVLRKLQAQGVNAVSLCIGAMRHFRSLHRVACDTTGRPNVWGPNKDRIIGQAHRWGPAKLETALTVLTDTDLKLRSAGQNAPAVALVERAFIRLAMLGSR